MARQKKKKLSQTELLSQKSANAVSVVRSVISSLKTTNEEAHALKESNTARIAEIKQENRFITNLYEKNEKIIQNFEDLLN